MTNIEKITEYEIHIEDMIKTIQARLNEFNEPDSLSEFEQGRKMAYLEIMDIIKTRHEMILNVIECKHGRV